MPTDRITLYSGPLSMFGAKVQIALLEKGVDFDLRIVHFEFDTGYNPKHPEVARINPKKQVPVLVRGNLELFDSTQLFEYVEDAFPQPPLWPRDVAARARARRLEHESDEVYFPHIIKLMGLEDQLAGEAAQQAIADAQAYCLKIEALLADREWLAGDFGYADIAFYMATLFGERKGAPLTQDMPRLKAWRDRMTQRPAVAAVAGPMARWLRSRGRPVPAFLATLLD